jgi:transcriptional antiterminator RfaH
MPWLVAQTAPSSERIAQDYATRGGATCYLPAIKRVRVVAGRRVVRRETLFPGYLLAAMSEEWRSLARVRGVTRLLMANERPALVADEAIDELRAMHDEDGFVRLPLAPDRFTCGDKVRAINGVFREFEGIYQGMGAHSRCQVLLDMLGAKRLIAIPEEDLIAA